LSTNATINPLDPEVLAKLQGLELRARHVVEGYVAGMHRSPYHGFSIEFAQHREYSPGDDLRYVDWKVFGKSDKYYLKQFEVETNLICYILLDVSESMSYQGPDAAMSKLQYAQTMAASLAQLVLQQQDSVGLVTFDHEVRHITKASSNPSHLRSLLHVMQETSAERKTAMGAILHQLAERIKRRSIIVVISDLLDDPEQMLAGLRHFQHRRHETIVMQVLDPAELDFPFQQMTLFEGLEQLPDVLTEPKALRDAYLNEMGQFLKQIREGCRQKHSDYLLVRTDQPLDLTLSSYLSARSHRRV